ncbi:unnamed protein product [Paramecium pentaurelia]|uniref:Uncharacterized protein n=1 Tax=Paramecium pentaurelia TaxID=43138 RepID=A0A8S1VN17_9CILI|nr:unnamed protein product [Paramecium pentaurelia]
MINKQDLFQIIFIQLFQIGYIIYFCIHEQRFSGYLMNRKFFRSNRKLRGGTFRLNQTLMWLVFALIDFNKRIEVDPNCSDFYFDRGKQDIDNEQQALVDYDIAMELDSNKSKAYNNRSLIGNTDIALINYNKSIELNSNDDYTYNSRGHRVLEYIGMLYQNNGKKMKALEDYNKAIELDPNIAQIQSSRALLHLSLEIKDQAIIDHNKAINLILKMLQIILTEDCFIEV